MNMPQFNRNLSYTALAAVAAISVGCAPSGNDDSGAGRRITLENCVATGPTRNVNTGLIRGEGPGATPEGRNIGEVSLFDCDGTRGRITVQAIAIGGEYTGDTIIDGQVYRLTGTLLNSRQYVGDRGDMGVYAVTIGLMRAEKINLAQNSRQR